MRAFDLFLLLTWTDGRTNSQHPIELQFYISVMFVSFPDKIHEEKPSFLDFKNNWLQRISEERTEK